MKKYLSVLLIPVLVLSFSLVMAVPVAAATINVPADQPTIQAAIIAASPGDTITVDAGAYNENVGVGKANLTIVGAGAATTTVTAVNAAQPVFNVNANNVRIQDFTITGAATAAGIHITGSSSSCAIRSNVITVNQCGIFIDSTGDDNRIYRNAITNNTEQGIHLPGITGHNPVIYNNIAGNGAFGAFAEPVPGDPNRRQGVSLNWWGHASGPGGAGPGTGDAVHGLVWYNPWLNRPIAATFADGIADVSLGIELAVGWNTLSTPLLLDGTSNQWNEIVARSGPLTYDVAYTYDPVGGWTALATTNDTFYLDPLEAVVIKMAAPGIVSLKVSTTPQPPGTKVLGAAWNLIGSAMPFQERELEMWKVLISVAHTPAGLVGYNMVVSPPLPMQGSWIYVRGQEAEEAFEWQKMHFGRGYWIYMENQDELAGFTSTPIGALVWD